MTIVLIPFYLIYVMNVGGISSEKEAREQTPYQLSLVALFQCLGSMICAVIFKDLCKFLHKKTVFIIGTIFNLLFAFNLLLLTNSVEDQNWIYVWVFCYGAGLSIQVCLALSLVADLIGPDGEQGAIVYATTGSAEKVVAGLIVLLITTH